MTVHCPKQDRLILRLRLNDRIPETRLPRNPPVREFPVSWENVIAPIRVVGVCQFLFLKLIRRRDGLPSHYQQKNQSFHATDHTHAKAGVNGGAAGGAVVFLMPTSPVSYTHLRAHETLR